MFKLEMRIFGINVNISINYDKNVNNNNVNAEEYESNQYDENKYELNAEEDETIVLSDIQLQASQFEEELRKQGTIFDIPSDSDYPSKRGISDDVEIITEQYEKEFEDIMEGRR